MAEDLTFTIEGDGASAEFTVPRDLVEELSEDGESTADTAADIVQMSFTSRAHMLVHHDDGAVDPTLEAAEERARELFEERFGMTYEEATGHSH